MPFEYEVIAEAREHAARGLMVGTPQRWLSTRGHLDPVVQREAAPELLDVLEDLHRAARRRSGGAGEAPDPASAE